MSESMTPTGLLLGFYGGIAVIGEVYQILFMPETKDKTLEEIDLVFSRPTMDIVRENLAGVKETMYNISRGRFRTIIAEQTKRRKSIAEPDA